MKFNSYTWRILLSVLLVSAKQLSYSQKAEGKINVQFEHTVGDVVLAVDSVFQNSLGESFSVRKFKYYISNIQLERADSKKSYLVKDQYFLVDETNPASKILTLSIPPGRYRSMSFLIGVDSLKNVSGAQTGALDPLNDMFWTWRSGYVMAKLEGSSPVSTLPRHMFEYHIGGFGGTYNVLQRVELPFSELVQLTPGKNSKINIHVDVNAWFHSLHLLGIAQHPACTSEGALAKQYAENYARMFSLQSVTSP